MLRIIALQLAGIALLFLPMNQTIADEPEKESPKSAGAIGSASLFGMGDIGQAASDLRKAGEAFERFGNESGDMVESITESMATMSSEFDPFGYKTAFRVVGQQAEMLERQREIIVALQQQEIERLRKENMELRRKLRELLGGE